MHKTLLATAPALLLLAGCWGSRYISADPTLEAIYVGKSYYEVVEDFGQPEVVSHDGMEGTVIAYYSASLYGSSAADMYSQYNVRNGATKEVGAPEGSIVFSFDTRMRCYAVDSDFQIERPKDKPQPKPQPVDRSKPVWTKAKMPRSIDFPYIERRSPLAEVVSIEKIDLSREKTTVHFMYRSRTPNHRPVMDSGIFVSPEVFIEDIATGNRYAMVATDGISLYPQYTRFAHNEGGYDVLVYSIDFEPLPADIEYVDIIEPGHSGYNFYRVDVRSINPLTEQENTK